MIDLNKKYRTRRGGEVKGLFEHAGVIRGTEVHEGNLIVHLWNHDGVAAAIGYRSDYDLIEVDEKEELLEEALRRYPNGTNFLTVDGDMLTSTGQMYVSPNNEVFVQCTCMSHYNVYLDGQWAEIVKEHTVDVILYQTPTGSILAGEKVFVGAFDKMIAKKKVTFYEGEGIS